MGVPSTDEIGVDLLRSDGYVEVTGDDDGHLVGSQTSGVVFGCMGNTAIVTDFPAVDCLFSGDVPNPVGLSDGYLIVSLTLPSPLLHQRWFRSICQVMNFSI